MKTILSFLCSFLIVSVSFAKDIDKQKVEKCIADYFAEPATGNKYVTTEAIFYFETEIEAIDKEEAAKTFAEANLEYLQQFIVKYRLNKEEALEVSARLYEILRKNDSEEDLDKAAIDVRSSVYTKAQEYVVQSIGKFYSTSDTVGETSNSSQTKAKQSQSKGVITTILNNENATLLLIVLGVAFVILLIMALSGKVVVFSSWGDLSITVALSAIAVGVAIYSEIVIGIIIGVGGGVYSCWQSSKQNNNFALSICVGILKMLCAIVLIVLLIIIFVASHAEGEKRKEARHYNLYGRDYKRADEANQTASLMGIFQKICVGLLNAFISNK
jgi:hypothetical protein